jgi:hypothetical protein
MSSNNISFNVGNQSFEIIQRPHFKFDLVENGQVRAAGLTPGEVYSFFAEKLSGAVEMIGNLNVKNETIFNTLKQELESMAAENDRKVGGGWKLSSILLLLVTIAQSYVMFT